MPLRELKCTVCGEVLTDLIHARDYDQWCEEVKAGDYLHEYDGGVLVYVMSLPASHSALSGYPFVTAPWLLPPKEVGNGMIIPQQVEIHSRAQYLSVLKANGMSEPITDGEKLTMYKPSAEAAKEKKLKDDVSGDMEFYTAMKNNPTARKNIIKRAVHKRQAAGL